MYVKTFDELPKHIYPSISVDIRDYFAEGKEAKIEIDYPCEPFNSKKTLIQIVNKLRKNYPSLIKWRFCQAMKCWGNVRLTFKNIERLDDENDLAEDNLIEETDKLFKSQFYLTSERFKFQDFICPLTSSLFKNSRQYACEPFEGEYISEFSLYYLGAFVLSSIARYQPHLWIRAITHSMIGDASANDYALAIIEKFMDTAITMIPVMVANAFEINNQVKEEVINDQPILGQ